MGKKNPIDPIEQWIAARFAERMIQRNFSVRALADALGIGKTRANSLRNGLISITLTDYERLCQLLGFSPVALMRDAEEAVAALQADLLDVVTGGGVDEAEIIPLRPLQAELPPATIPHRMVSADELSLPAAAKTSPKVKARIRNGEDPRAD